ncbi:hypothetical protein [Pelolinea submarina]|uniref:Uncharacterized protein n=1 Tax=Pelolinea submarina TaxID=913107 RepID=A0A3E0AF81_9CHLR|nr:hypothetical protein [Pelolinea submarina]REG10309.1 hypothetical protein DFR64_0164 [Pelolinea submarina]
MEKKRKRRLVRRYYAERYLLVTIISFAFSVSITRFFLELTGYPQIGGSELHIAHVLWGGLLLFIGGLFPLIFVNKRAFDLSAFFSGVGVGLFIDEVGKFISRSNDYFFPAAAPIIYIFFLLTLLVFVLVRRSRADVGLRATLYHVIEQFEEILEGDLSELERDRMLRSIQRALHDKQDAGLTSLGNDLIAYLQAQEDNLVPHQPDFLEKISDDYLRFEARIFNHTHFYRRLMIAWGVWGIVALIHPLFALLSAQTKMSFSGIWGSLFISDLLLLSPDISISGIIRLAGEALGGLLLIVAVVLGMRGLKRPAIALAMLSLLLTTLVINIFIFYFDQFSSVFYAFMQLILLAVTVRYNRHIP